MCASSGRIVVAAAAGLLAGWPALAQRATGGNASPMTVEDVLALKSIGDLAISPDGHAVAFVVTAPDFDENRNDSDVWVVSTSGGEAARLTYHPGVDGSPAWSPDGSWVAFLSDRTGKTQVHGIQPDGGESWQVTEAETGVSAFGFSPDGRRIGVIALAPLTDADRALEERRGRPIVWDSAYTDQWARLWVGSVNDRRADTLELSSPDTLFVMGFTWGPDSRSLAWSARPSPVLRTFERGATFVQNEPGAAPRRVTEFEGFHNPASWTAANGLLVVAGRALGTANWRLWHVPVPGGEATSLSEGIDANVSFVHATATAVLVEASHRTGRRLYRIPLRNRRPAGNPVVVSDDRAYYSGFSATADGERIAFLAEDGAVPAEVHVSPAAAFQPRRRTHLQAEVAAFSLGEQRVAEWTSRADGETIEGVLTLPVGYAGGRVPLLLVIHGGPSGISANRFNASWVAYPIQVFAGLGYAVLQPNYRGSSGYGERFRGLNRGDISGRDWIDIDSGVDALVQRGIADPDRLGIMGWSFGGHHTFWGITQTDRFAAASAGAGANDLISMYAQTDLPEFYHTYLGPKPWEDFDLYEGRSAYRFVTRVATPLLIQVGERDERVPAEQSIQFYEAVRAIGNVPVSLVLYPGQGHVVREPRLMRDLIGRNVEWFTRWIPTAPRPVGARE